MLCHMCHGRRCGCGVWVPQSRLMRCMCHGCGLHTLCIVVVGVVHGVVVVVFTCVAWGHGCRQCTMCVVVAVFVPCVLWWWVWRMGLQLQSLCCVCCGCRCSTSGHSCGLHVCVAVDVLCVSQLRSSCHVCYGCSLCAVCVVVTGVAYGVVVTVVVFMPCASWPWVHCVWSQSWVLSLRCMHCSCHLCTVCGVAVALFTLRGVLPVPLLYQVWCCSYGHCAACGVCSHKRGGNRAARRDMAMWCTQLGRA